ncbi:MAG: synthase delta subunit [Mycobacterium sp.]|nr:synthase delta subunit [Mycobacterium sp.]
MALALTGTSRAARQAAEEVLEQQLRSGADTATLASELDAVADLLGSSSRVRRALTDPGRPAEAHEQLFVTLFGGKLSAPALTVGVAAVRQRWSEPEDLVIALDALGAQARLAAAESNDELADVEDELFRFGRTVEREPRLLLALSDPALPTERKLALLRALLENKAKSLTLQLATRAVLQPRGRSLAAALEELADLAAARRQRRVARVRSARPLDAGQQARIADAIRASYGSAVQLEVDVDPRLIGGVVVEIGGDVIDGSIARRIAEARRGLTLG